MAISPINFSVATPIQTIGRVERVKRRNKADVDPDEEGHAPRSAANRRTQAAVMPEERTSDSAREALQNIRLGG